MNYNQLPTNMKTEITNALQNIENYNHGSEVASFIGKGTSLIMKFQRLKAAGFPEDTNQFLSILEGEGITASALTEAGLSICGHKLTVAASEVETVVA